MKAKELKKKQALCDVIDMKFNEANELFEMETLQNMQMVQICGGTTVAPVAVWQTIKNGTYVVTTLMEMFNTTTEFLNVWRSVTGNAGGTPPPNNATVELTRRPDGGLQLKVTGTAQIDSIITPEIKIYGVDTTPTPIGNSGSGSTDMP